MFFFQLFESSWGQQRHLTRQESTTDESIVYFEASKLVNFGKHKCYYSSQLGVVGGTTCVIDWIMDSKKIHESELSQHQVIMHNLLFIYTYSCGVSFS